MKTKYSYKGRSGDRMYWEAQMPGDSRVEQISCDWGWFWQRDPDPSRCPMRATDPITTRHPRDDGWRCGYGAGHSGGHTLYSAEGESVLFAGRWVHPDEVGLTPTNPEPMEPP